MTASDGAIYLDKIRFSVWTKYVFRDAVSFVRNNSRKKWWKESDHREELPDYPERAVTEAIANAIIHRDYMQLGSEIHII